MSEIIKAVLNSEEKADLQELIGYLIGSGNRYFSAIKFYIFWRNTALNKISPLTFTNPRV
ncbi:hypothetical protein [[Phormidium] sp. ETS-05]|uniref:hypothetical protein n=1 Tax=[Phormidium] sp. ETS-05 TaxID=222819 RepID=UPI0031FECED1